MRVDAAPWARNELGNEAVDMLKAVPSKQTLSLIGASPRGPWTVRLATPGHATYEKFNETDLLRGVRDALNWANEGTDA